MITFIYGENNYLSHQKLRSIIQAFEPKEGIERYEAKDIIPGDLPNILSGLSLFSPKRLVIIADASENKELWADIAQYLPSISGELHLVIYEEAVDKRTKTFKDLYKLAQTSEMKEPSEGEALSWLLDEAKKRNIKLSSSQAQLIMSRVGLNQWRLHFALEKLAGMEQVDESVIEDIIEASPQASVFVLIDAALNRQAEKVQLIVKILRVSDDPYFFFGLLASQLFQLVALASTKKSPNDVAKDLGVHPYPLQKMQSTARRLGRDDIKKTAEIMADCDTQLKRSGAEPWDVVELALLKLAK